jgi:hypothetical protein
MLAKLVEWFKHLVSNGTAEPTPPQASLVGLPVTINPGAHSKVMLARHAGRLHTLYGAEQVGSIKQEIARRRAFLKSAIGIDPGNAAEARALLDMLRG